MAVDSETSNPKTRDASYYREYRRRKKTGRGNLIRFPAPIKDLVRTETSPRQSQTMSLLQYRIIFVAVFILTALLIELSVPFYQQTHSLGMAYALAITVELTLLFLITLKVRGRMERLLKGTLLILLSGYALLPIAIKPIQEGIRNVSVVQHQAVSLSQQVQSLQSEINVRKEKIPYLIKRNHQTAAQRELQAVAQLENQLRNTIAREQPEPATAATELQTSYIVALQRLLLMLCNFYFVHYLTTRRREGRLSQARYPLVARHCTT